MANCQLESLISRFPVLEQDYIRVSATLKHKRLSHTLGVLETACQLTDLYGGDLLAVCRGALYHDLFKGIQKSELLNLGKTLGYEVGGIADELPEIAHGPIAALWLEQEGILTDPLALNAIRYHTVGRAGMTVEEKIVYLADAIEPGRDYPGMDLLRLTAEISLDQALLLSVTQTISFVLEAGRPIHPLSVEMRNSLMQSPEK